MTDYNQQAQDFLNKWGIDISVKFVDTSCPLFCDKNKHIHGHKYKITLKRPLNKKRISFPYWNSFNDSRENKLPSPYDVLSCIFSDLSCPDIFEDFCAEYGYNTDSRKALSTFKRCSTHAEKLNSFFDNEEMVADLQNIN